MGWRKNYENLHLLHKNHADYKEQKIVIFCGAPNVQSERVNMSNLDFFLLNQ